MQYCITFLEGMISFISPCLLPMLPIYISYFAGTKEQKNTAEILVNVAAFVGGFTLVFMALGMFAGSVGRLFIQYQTVFNVVCGVVVVLFGLSFFGVFQLKGVHFRGVDRLIGEGGGLFSSFLFGLVFSISWTPCVGAFLGSALTMASQQGSALQGGMLLLSYSAGLGIPFLLSAVLIEQLKSAFSVLKKHYNVINRVSGLFLIFVGILMMTGTLGNWLRMLQ